MVDVDENHGNLKIMKLRAGIILVVILAGNLLALVTWIAGHDLGALIIYIGMILLVVILFVEAVWAANR